MGISWRGVDDGENPMDGVQVATLFHALAHMNRIN